jgi:uncharacterized membrane protein
MLLDSLAGMSGITLICAGVVVLARTQGPELSLPALLGIVWELAGAGSAALTWRGLLPGWAVPVVVVLAVAAVWALVVGRRRSHIVRRATGFAPLDDSA